MKLNKLTLASALAAIGLVASGPSLQAAIAYSPGDIFLGFRSSANDTSYLVNIGQVSQFRNAGASPFQLTIGSVGTDLTAFYFEETWFESASVTWSISGAIRSSIAGEALNTIYATRAEGAQPWARAGFSTQSFATASWEGLKNNYLREDDLSPRSPANNPFSVEQSDFDINSYHSYFTDTSSFKHFPGSTETSFEGGVAGANLDFFRMAPGSGSGEYLGTFSISELGVITFTPVPEPGVIALLTLGGGFAAFAGIRRLRRRA